MKIKSIFTFTVFSILVMLSVANGQQKKPFDLQKLLKENKLVAYKAVTPITDGTRSGVSGSGIVWLKDVSFSNGTIEVDLRGKDVPQRSFLGIAFHGVDTTTYDVIYFRPFNFRSTDSVKKIHAVQYISHPMYTWKKLREEHPGQYEKGITPPPLATDWFHARIEVNNGEVSVFVDQAATPSLKVKTLNTRKDGLIGLWDF